MYSHIMLGANDIDESKKFYDATLGTLGCNPGVIDENGRCFYITDTGTFALSKPIDGEPASCGNGSTIGFKASDPEAINAWHEAGISAGGSTCEDPPGIREGSFGRLYLAYLRDPSGNKICTMCRVK